MGKICKWDDWWRHTLNPILYQAYKWGYLDQFAVQNIETWQADSSTGNTQSYKKFCSHGNSFFSSPHSLDFNKLVIFSLKNVKQGHKRELTYLQYMLAGSCIWSAVNKYQNGLAKVAKKASNMGRSRTQYVARVTELLTLHWRAHLHVVECYCKVANIFDTNWLRYLFSSYWTKSGWVSDVVTWLICIF